jgi:NitT/TauT family transport system ATP-binding protein
MEIQFQKKNLTPQQRRNQPEFKDYFQEIWREINEDNKKQT